MGGKNTEVARSTCFFTHTIDYQAKFDMAAFNKTSRICSTYSCISPFQIGRDGGGQYMYPACKYVAVVIQEFDRVNC